MGFEWNLGNTFDATYDESSHHAVDGYYGQKFENSGVATETCPVILWDNMHTASTSDNVSERHGYLNRANCTWFFPTLVNTMVTKAGGQVDVTHH